MKKTQENLLKAFAGESMARNKYTFYAQQARKEGLEWIARVFEETADNERAHAEREFQFIEGEVKTLDNLAIGKIGKTLENLKAAAAGERGEWEGMYPEFEKAAREEGEEKIADVFKEIGEVEEKHEERYLKLAEKMEKGELFKSEDEKTEWKCLNCGYVHHGKKAPTVCPACAKPQGFYMQEGLVQ